MPSGNELYLWWSGEAESMFVYYLTGAISIAFIATLLITRSLRRHEPIVTELLHEDNARETLLTYMLKIVTSVFPGHGCPQSAKVFMRLTGQKKVSQYFQLRSNTGGKAMLQRGYTDIFLFKVPESVGDILSVELLLSGVEIPLKWKLEEVQLYSPSSKVRKILPVTVTLLEVLYLEPSENIFVVNSINENQLKVQLLFHQWIAGYGNTVRLGAFTEVVHAVLLFISLFSLLILSQIFYIALPRGIYVPPTQATPTNMFSDNEEDDDDAGPFDLNISSFLVGATLTSAVCFLLTFGLEILLRNVKSREQDPGKAYKCLCETEKSESLKQTKSVTNLDEFKMYFMVPLFMKHHAAVKDELIGFVNKEHKNEVAIYLAQLLSYLQAEHKIYEKVLKAFRRKAALRLKIKKEEPQEEPLTEEDEEHVISLPDASKISLSKLLTSEPTIPLKLGDSFLDMLKKKKMALTSEKRETSEVTEIDIYSSLKHLLFDDNDVNSETDTDAGGSSRCEIDIEATNDATASFESIEIKGNWIVDSLDRSVNARIDDFDNITVIDETRKPEEKADHSNTLKDHSGEMKENLSDENISKVVKWIESSERRQAAKKGFVETWQASERTWCRRVIKEFCDLIRTTREMVISDRLCFCEIHSKLIDSSHCVVQLLLVACSVHCNNEQYKVLVSYEMLRFLWHMSMEIMVSILQELFQILQCKDSAVLADLVLQSHHVMTIVRHAVHPIMFMVQYGIEQLYLLRLMPLQQDLHYVFVELVQICFQLVVKYNLILWQNLKLLMVRDLKDHLDDRSYNQLAAFVQDNIQDRSSEDIAIKRLCNFIEENSKEEAWEEIHSEEKFYSNILVKIQLVKNLKSKISHLTKKKHKFDKVHDLLPKEPKSRLQLLVERRRKAPELQMFEDAQNSVGNQQDGQVGKHVHWDVKARIDAAGSVPRKELEKESQDLGQYIENLTTVYERLKKMFDRVGVTQKVNASELLAQAVLHPHVIVTLRQADVAGMYKFENYLHLKRAENMLAQCYEVVVKELVEYLIKNVTKEHNLMAAQQDVQIDAIINEISVKLDIMSEILSGDLEKIMHQCMKVETIIDTSNMKNAIPLNLIVKPSVNSLLHTPSLRKWSGINIDCTPLLEVSELSKLLKYEEMDICELLQYYKNNSADENNSNQGPIVDPDEIHFEINTNTWSVKDIIEDLKPLKGYLEYLQHGEMLRGFVTQMGYIERAKEKREYFNSVQINNIIDSYYMLEEGDDSKTLTKAGLYQLEHDCVGENIKPLPHWVKSFTVMLMVVVLLFIIVYITVIGGQFSTTDLQEWMCYYLLAVAMFGFGLEPFRAYVVATYVDRWKKKVTPMTCKLQTVEIL